MTPLHLSLLLASAVPESGTGLTGVLLGIVGGFAGGFAHGLLVEHVHRKRMVARCAATRKRCLALAELLASARTRDEYVSFQAEVMELFHDACTCGAGASDESVWNIRADALKSLRFQLIALHHGHRDTVPAALTQIGESAARLRTACVDPPDHQPPSTA